MKTLIIGEVVEGKLSSGALEIIAKSKEVKVRSDIYRIHHPALFPSLSPHWF